MSVYTSQPDPRLVSLFLLLYLPNTYIMSVVPPPLPALSMSAGPSSHGRNIKPSRSFDVVAAYKRALADDSVSPRVPRLEVGVALTGPQVPHPIAAILALVELMEASTGKLNRS